MSIHDLTTLLRSMQPDRRPGQFVFVDGDRLPPAVPVEASVREPEGLSVVVPRASADEHGAPYDYVAAWITLTVHSALDAVGLTAAVAAALASAGISCNVVAGLHHDHLLVGDEDADRALAVLRRLQAGVDPSSG